MVVRWRSGIDIMRYHGEYIVPPLILFTRCIIFYHDRLQRDNCRQLNRVEIKGVKKAQCVSGDMCDTPSSGITSHGEKNPLNPAHMESARRGLLR